MENFHFMMSMIFMFLKCNAEQAVIIPNLLETFQFIPHSSFVSVFKKFSKNLNFKSFFTSKKLWWLLSVKSVHSLSETMKLKKVYTFQIC